MGEQYLPLDLCQELKALGYPQSESYAWCLDYHGRWHPHRGVESTVGRFDSGWDSFGTWVACPSILPVLDWLEQVKGIRWGRLCETQTYQALLITPEGDVWIGTDEWILDPVELIRRILTHFQMQNTKQ